MGIFDFLRRQDATFLDESPERIWERFRAAVESGSSRQLLKLCRSCRPRIDELFEIWRKPPDDICEDRVHVRNCSSGGLSDGAGSSQSGPAGAIGQQSDKPIVITERG